MRTRAPLGAAGGAPMLRTAVLLNMAGVSSALRGTLYDMPVSNNGARCRYILYKKGVDAVDVVSPAELGGLKSDEYLALNPQGKMPLLVVDDGGAKVPIYESDAIARFLVAQYAASGPDFGAGGSPLLQAESDQLVRLHDGYLQALQGCMYKAQPQSTWGTRAHALEDLLKQLKIMNDCAERFNRGEGQYLLGTAEPMLCDATIFPTLVFTTYMLPTHFGKSREEACGGAYAMQWFDAMKAGDAEAARVADEVQGALDGWNANGRWSTIQGTVHKSDADEANDSIFGKILRGEIPSKFVYEDDFVASFADINPATPKHHLVIPKSRNGLERLADATEDHVEVLGRLLLGAVKVYKQNVEDGESGFRLVINDGEQGGQEVPHLHAHVLQGRSMRWPPG